MNNVDYAPDLLIWHEVYRFDERLKAWVKWATLDTERYGMEVVKREIKYLNLSYPNQKSRIMKYHREEVTI